MQVLLETNQQLLMELFAYPVPQGLTIEKRVADHRQTAFTVQKANIRRPPAVVMTLVLNVELVTMPTLQPQ